jgi:predicted porin
MVAAGYKLDALTLKAAWIDNDDVARGGTSDDNTAWQVGASYALTPQLAVGGNYLQHDSGSFMANLQARYALAKNLVVYGMLNHVDNDDNGPNFRALWGAGGVGEGLTNGGSGTALATGVIISF